MQKSAQGCQKSDKVKRRQSEHLFVSQKSVERKTLSYMEHHDPERRRHPVPRGGHPGEGQGEPYPAQHSFTHGVIQPRPAAVQNPIKGGEAQAKKTIKEAVP